MRLIDASLLFAGLVGPACYSPELASADGTIADAGSSVDAPGVADANVDAECDDLDPCTIADAFTDGGGCRGQAAAPPAACSGAVIVPRGGSCYAFCPGERTWQAGRLDCAATGWTLVTIDDGAEDSWIDSTFVR